MPPKRIIKPKIPFDPSDVPNSSSFEADNYVCVKSQYNYFSVLSMKSFVLKLVVPVDSSIIKRGFQGAIRDDGKVATWEVIETGSQEDCNVAMKYLSKQHKRLNSDGEEEEEEEVTKPGKRTSVQLESTDDENEEVISDRGSTPSFVADIEDEDLNTAGVDPLQAHMLNLLKSMSSKQDVLVKEVNSLKSQVTALTDKQSKPSNFMDQSKSSETTLKPNLKRHAKDIPDVLPMSLDEAKNYIKTNSDIDVSKYTVKSNNASGYAMLGLSVSRDVWSSEELQNGLMPPVGKSSTSSRTVYSPESVKLFKCLMVVLIGHDKVSRFWTRIKYSVDQSGRDKKKKLKATYLKVKSPKTINAEHPTPHVTVTPRKSPRIASSTSNPSTSAPSTPPELPAVAPIRSTRQAKVRVSKTGKVLFG